MILFSANVTYASENQKLLTKGDNNYLDDVELYQGLDLLERNHIVGKVTGYVYASRSHAVEGPILNMRYDF